MEEAIHRRFAGLPPDSLPRDIRFVCVASEAIDPPEVLKDLWISDDGIGDRLLDELNWSTLEGLSAIIMVCNVGDPTNADDTARVAQWLSTDQVVPPVILLPMTPLGAPRVPPARYEEMFQTCFDDWIPGDPSGYTLAFSIRALVSRAEAKSDKGAEELQDRLIAAEDLQAFRDRLDSTVWSYLPQRLVVNLPVIDYNLGDAGGKEFSGYRVGNQLPFSADELMYRLYPPAHVRVAPGGEMVKIIPKSSLPRSVDTLRRLHRTWQIVQAVSGRWSHPCIPVCLQIYHAPSCFYMRMEMAGTESLFHRLQSRGAASLSSQQMCSVISQLSSVVHHLHTGPNITHRSIKPESVVLAETAAGGLRMKLINFDTAAIQLPGSTCRTKVGTFPFVAPEVGNGKYDGFAADMWSLGVLILELACGVGVVEEQIQWQPDGTTDGEPGPKAFPMSAAKQIAEVFSDRDAIRKLLSEKRSDISSELSRWLGDAVYNLTRLGPRERWSSRRLDFAVQEMQCTT